MNNTANISVNQEITFTEIEGEIILLSPETNQYHGLNAVGAFIWQLLYREPMPLPHIRLHVQSKYKINAEATLQDVNLFIESMLASSFLVLADEA